MLTDFKMSGAYRGLDYNLYGSSENESGQRKGAGRALERWESFWESQESFWESWESFLESWESFWESWESLFREFTKQSR